MPDFTTQMQNIKTLWGAAIDAAAGVSSVPASFLAALIGNESGGNPAAKRFEPKVLLALWEVLLARKAAYGSIGRGDLVNFLASMQVDAFQRLDSLATSQGLTQIMGYEAISFHLDSAAALQDPAKELVITTKMLAEYAQRDQFDLAVDFSEMFDCWNTGRPHAPTFDPQYIPNGLARKAVYEALP